MVNKTEENAIGGVPSTWSYSNRTSLGDDTCTGLDFEAKNLSKPGEDGEPQNIVVAVGITPSGEFHIGHLREILTCEMIYRASRNWSWKLGDARYVDIEHILSQLGISIEQWEENIQIARANNELALEFIFIVDSADPLRKVYPFLDESYEQFIGHQLGRIPPPDFRMVHLIIRDMMMAKVNHMQIIFFRHLSRHSRKLVSD